MKTIFSRYYALCSAAAAILAGCGGAAQLPKPYRADAASATTSTAGRARFLKRHRAARMSGLAIRKRSSIASGAETTE